MSYEPEIIEAQDRAVLKSIVERETLAVAWDASQGPEFIELMKHVRAFRQAATMDELDPALDPVVEYAQRIIDTEIDPLLRSAGFSFSGYDPLHTWIESGDDEMRTFASALPHRDFPCIGVFFNFNEQADLNTSCVPAEYAGAEDGADRSFPNAELDKAQSFAPQSVALVKLGEITHLGPQKIPEGVVRIAMHARYDLF